MIAGRLLSRLIIANSFLETFLYFVSFYFLTRYLHRVKRYALQTRNRPTSLDRSLL